MRKNLLFGILFILSLSSPAVAATFTDAVDRQISIDYTPLRIVSLVPSVTEILFALGLEKHIAAVTDFCTYPEAALKLSRVGGYTDPSLESILLHQPDLVIAGAGMNRPSLVRRLEIMKIPVYVIHPQTVAATLTTIEQIGRITGAEQQSMQLVDSIRSRIERIQQQVAKLDPPTALATIMLQPLTVAGPDTFVADMIKIAGGKNVVPEGPSRYPTWNPEALLITNPAIIFVSTYTGQPPPKYFFDKWPQLQAVRRQQIIQIEADWIHRPGPRLILGIEALAKALHPDILIDE